MKYILIGLIGFILYKTARLVLTRARYSIQAKEDPEPLDDTSLQNCSVRYHYSQALVGLIALLMMLMIGLSVIHLTG